MITVPFPQRLGWLAPSSFQVRGRTQLPWGIYGGQKKTHSDADGLVSRTRFIPFYQRKILFRNSTNFNHLECKKYIELRISQRKLDVRMHMCSQAQNLYVSKSRDSTPIAILGRHTTYASLSIDFPAMKRTIRTIMCNTLTTAVLRRASLEARLAVEVRRLRGAVPRARRVDAAPTAVFLLEVNHVALIHVCNAERQRDELDWKYRPADLGLRLSSRSLSRWWVTRGFRLREFLKDGLMIWDGGLCRRCRNIWYFIRWFV